MWAFLGRMILMALAEDTVKTVVKDVIKRKITSRTSSNLDDDLVDIVFNSKSKESLSRGIINYGTNALVESIGSGITNNDINNFLEKSVKSKHNGKKMSSFTTLWLPSFLLLN